MLLIRREIIPPRDTKLQETRLCRSRKKILFNDAGYYTVILFKNESFGKEQSINTGCFSYGGKKKKKELCLDLGHRASGSCPSFSTDFLLKMPQTSLGVTHLF